MKRLLMLAVVILLLAAVAGIAIAQTPEDEQLIADFMRARGFDFAPARATRISGIWLNDMDRIRPTLEARVTTAAQTAEAQTPTSFDRECGHPRLPAGSFSRSIFTQDEDITAFFYGGAPGEKIRLTVASADISIDGVTEFDDQYGASGALTTKISQLGLAVLDCQWVDEGTVGGRRVTIREGSSPPTPTPQQEATTTPSEEAEPTAQPWRACGKPIDRYSNQRTERTVAGGQVLVFFYGGIPGEAVTVDVRGAGDTTSRVEATTVPNESYGAYAAVPITVEAGNNFSIAVCNWAQWADEDDERINVDVRRGSRGIGAILPMTPTPRPTMQASNPIYREWRVPECAPTKSLFYKDDVILVKFSDGFLHEPELLSFAGETVTNPFLNGVLIHMEKSGMYDTTSYFSPLWVDRSTSGEEVLYCIWGAGSWSPVTVKWTTDPAPSQ